MSEEIPERSPPSSVAMAAPEASSVQVTSWAPCRDYWSLDDNPDRPFVQGQNFLHNPGDIGDRVAAVFGLLAANAVVVLKWGVSSHTHKQRENKMSIGKNGRLLAVLLCAGLIQACASFPQEALKDSQLPNPSLLASKPTVYIDLKFMNGEPGASNAVELPSAKAQIQPAVDSVLQKSGLFKSYTFDAFQQDKTDRTIQLYFYNHGSVGAASVAGFITGFTFGLIPSAATDEYTLVTQVKANGQAVGGQLRSDDSVRTWFGIWFLPAAGKTPAKAIQQTVEEMVRDALAQMVSSKQLALTAAPEYLVLRAE